MFKGNDFRLHLKFKRNCEILEAKHFKANFQEKKMCVILVLINMNKIIMPSAARRRYIIPEILLDIESPVYLTYEEF